MRIGFIGAGGHARNTHLSLMKRIKGVKVAGIADLSMETAGAAVRDFGGEAFGDAGKMLDTVKPDAVFVCVSPSAHGEIENMLIDRSIPFLVEKPIALDLGKAHEIEKKIKQKKLIVASGYQWRYLDLLERARELIGNFPVLLVQGYWLSKRPAVSWWHNPSLSGGQIVEQATHMIDLTRYLLGEPLELHAVMSPPAEGSAVPAASVLTIRYPGSVPASIICACALPVRYRCGFIIHTEKVIIELFSTASGMMNIVLSVRTPGGTESFSPSYDAVLRQDEVFIDAVRTGDASGIRSDYSNAVASLAVSLMANESQKLNKSISCR